MKIHKTYKKKAFLNEKFIQMNVYLHPNSEREKFLLRGEQHARDFKAFQVKLKVIYKKQVQMFHQDMGFKTLRNIKAGNERGVL